jgi:16S rRNA (adenine1518-N6/adenine1519-N6)-dimethyltransferase
MKLRAKKTLGQNFLKNKKILEKIIQAGKIKSDELILEIGPGKGALTQELLKTGNNVIAVEKDSRLITFLEEKFQEEIESGQFKLLEGDALELDYEKLNLVNQDFIIVANLPYYITGKFLSSTLSNDNQPKKIVLLLQKEIVERITGEERQNGKNKKNNKENILSVSVKVYGDPKYITTVSRKNFSPEPKVDSAVLAIYNVSKGFFQDNNILEQDFFVFVKLAFGNKRKTLIKNLSQKFEKQNVEQILVKQNIDTRIRAEDLSVEELKEIFLSLK